MPRTLYHFPIIHSQADLGNLSRAVNRFVLRRQGIAGLRWKIGFVEALWQEIERKTKALAATGERFRLYQDALPVCGHELDIVRDLAASGSRNHRILLRLVEQGALLEGTESGPLLIEEYQRAKQVLEPQPDGNPTVLQAPADAPDVEETLLQRRDRFIARRIHETLQPGESGILFLGLLHRVESHLSDEIRVVYPLNGTVEETKDRS